MWLLSTSRAELHQFSGASSIPGGYAVLSHTWSRAGEQSFQDVQAIGRRCKVLRQNPRKQVSPKIRNCCIQAERDGYAWVWIDTCCIDKTSSTELSEAINSMFTWYVHAEVCYAHLEDVDSDDNVFAKTSDFRKARWHTRCWTLQELLAPALVIFFSKDWHQIGTKESLASLLEDITGIHSTFLKRESNFLITSISTRMRWAANRKSTRIEDEAYCLLGIFGISMPTIYGEGARAFQRLQEEIAKHSFDTTLFVWNDTHRNKDVDLRAQSLEEVRSLSSDLDERYLFAPSAQTFNYGEHVYYTPRLASSIALQPYAFHQWTEDNKQPKDGPFGRFEFPSFEVTNYGMKCRFPIAEVDQFTIAVLLCETTTDHVGLLLYPAVDDEVQDPSRKMYYIGHGFETSSQSFRYVRLAHLGRDLYNLRFRGKTFRAEWRDIYIAAGNSASKNDVLIHWSTDRSTPMAFRVPRHIIRSIWSLDLDPHSAILPATTDEPLHLVVAFANAHTKVGEGVRIHLGLCGRVAHQPHWAGVEIDNAPALARDRPRGEEGAPWHDCDADHIEAWPDWAREVGNAERTVRIAFARCPHNPRAHRRVLTRIELAGEEFDALVRWKKGGEEDPRREERRREKQRTSNRAGDGQSDEDNDGAEKPPERGEDVAETGAAQPDKTDTSATPSEPPLADRTQLEQHKDAASQHCSSKRVSRTFRAAKSYVGTLSWPRYTSR